MENDVVSVIAEGVKYTCMWIYVYSRDEDETTTNCCSIISAGNI